MRWSSTARWSNFYMSTGTKSSLRSTSILAVCNILWYKTVANELEAGPSQGDEYVPVLPVQTQPQEMVCWTEADPLPDEVNVPQRDQSGEELEREAANEGSAASDQGENREDPTEAAATDVSSEDERWHVALAARYQTML
uniref:Uncharacterized protein n=2 Tax=Parascaris univalens TaxID=6257 RepID=A0A915AAA6_PARUN